MMIFVYYLLISWDLWNNESIIHEASTATSFGTLAAASVREKETKFKETSAS